MDKENSEITSQDRSGNGTPNKIPARRRRDGLEAGDGVQNASHVNKQNKIGNLLSSVSSQKVVSQSITDNYAIYNGDSCDVLKGIPNDSIHFQICSPPFADLYVYSNSERDLGNNKSNELFFEHYKFIIEQQFRICMPGRLCAIHVMQLPSSKTKHGYIGLRDFRGECIRMFIEAGFIYHSEVCIWKNPVTAMQRTKALGLLHKQIKKDSCMSRMGIADYLIAFRKPGDNPERVEHTPESFPVEVWQRYASPVWASVEEGIGDDGFIKFEDNHSESECEDDGIDQGNTLQARSAREHADERHLCCLQLGVIKRAVNLWSNPGDVVLSPFAGIGSEGYRAIQMGRKFVGIELKESYYKQAVLNLIAAQQSQENLLLK